MTAWTNLQTRCDRYVWGDDLRRLEGARRWIVTALRLSYAVFRELLRGELNLRAMGLVYTTLLAIVPALAVSFTLLKTFGVHHNAQPLLEQFLAPVGPGSEQLAVDIIDFVEGVEVTVLGSVGVGLLVYTVISLLHKIEEAFNWVWRIDSLRALGRRVANYLSVILVGPALVFGAIGISTSLGRIEPLGWMLSWGSRLAPTLMVWLAFSFVYYFVPNTRVRLRPAVGGAAVAALLWQATGMVFSAVIASSGRYAAIYSSFAIGILVLIWLFVSWLILLIGAQVSFYIQNPQYLTAKPVRLQLSNELKERIALSVMYLVGEHHRRRQPPWTLEGLTERLDLPTGAVHRTVTMLQQEGFLEPTAAEPPAYLPAGSIESIPLDDLFRAVRRSEDRDFPAQEGLPFPGPVEELIDEVRQSRRGALAGRTLGDLIGNG